MPSSTRNRYSAFSDRRLVAESWPGNLALAASQLAISAAAKVGTISSFTPSPHPRWPANGSHESLRAPRREIDKEPVNRTLRHSLQMFAQPLDSPIGNEL